MALEFRGWPKIPRLLDSNVILTEKIDGTNACVVIQPAEGDLNLALENAPTNAKTIVIPGTPPDFENSHVVYVGAQSRTRLITPEQDNHGFARWVWDNAEALGYTLGFGYHYGEWWGSGINRGYGLTKGEKRFSLFNSGRWQPEDFDGEQRHDTVPGLGVVPVLAITTGDNLNYAVEVTSNNLRTLGSMAAPGFMKPEGLVVYHVAARKTFKVLLEGDGKPKGQQ